MHSYTASAACRLRAQPGRLSANISFLACTRLRSRKSLPPLSMLASGSLTWKYCAATTIIRSNIGATGLRRTAAGSRYFRRTVLPHVGILSGGRAGWLPQRFEYGVSAAAVPADRFGADQARLHDGRRQEQHVTACDLIWRATLPLSTFARPYSRGSSSDEGHRYRHPRPLRPSAIRGSGNIRAHRSSPSRSAKDGACARLVLLLALRPRSNSCRFLIPA